MSKITQIFAALAGLIHVLFFLMESVLWMNPNVHSVFLVKNLADAETLDVYVQNQGFYNLFLAIGIFAALALVKRNREVATALITYICLFMIGAALVLRFTIPDMASGVFIQGVPPLIALITMAVNRRK